ncbi:hypothetical protein L211DRAFT_842704 [Terfezia boudieri ATCC MYA-4762]|uniref:Uncharacterized protein n=1 Tax=Terfezia boudieri ATCC MYA-4762 TaxID=1051890 RepID=A0A3N4L8X3_9PEZI|nr:hypothetical protein L211DRAFT_842704 [Terfezia boudieri ATCC MYA-4762]
MPSIWLPSRPTYFWFICVLFLPQPCIRTSVNRIFPCVLIDLLVVITMGIAVSAL